MARMGKNELARYEGALWLLAIVKERGLEAAIDELSWRGCRGVPLNVEKSEISRYEQRIKAHTVKTICCLATLTIHDEFDFGTEECARFIRRFNSKTDGLVDDIVTWPDYAQALRDELDIEVDDEREFEDELEQLKNEWRKERLEGHN